MARSKQSSRDWIERASDRGCAALAVLRARRHLVRYPEDGFAWCALGVDLTSLARYEEAAAALAKAIELCPSAAHRVLFTYWGRLYREAGDYEKAVDWYRKAIEAAPDEASGYLFLGAMLAKQGRLIEAEEIHRRATECTSGCIDEAYLNLGFVLRAQERFAEAADCFRETLRIDPEDKPAKRALRDVESCLRLR
ncbi:MAG: tetratricopeptide repeat protein [Planctomycetota bacterium]|nr:tetratricopeptide repeat protein [Planctomycetaceae bacterium]MDQ3332559.1 tetratricopeptide repeat protein [Planctomycetota bacterium]